MKKWLDMLYIIEGVDPGSAFYNEANFGAEDITSTTN